MASPVQQSKAPLLSVFYINLLHVFSCSNGSLCPHESRLTIRSDKLLCQHGSRSLKTATRATNLAIQFAADVIACPYTSANKWECMSRVCSSLHQLTNATESGAGSSSTSTSVLLDLCAHSGGANWSSKLPKRTFPTPPAWYTRCGLMCY